MKAGDQLTLPAVQVVASRCEALLVETARRTRPEAKKIAQDLAGALTEALALWTEPEPGTPPRPTWESEDGDSSDEPTAAHVLPQCSMAHCPWYQPRRYREAIELTENPNARLLNLQPMCAHPSRTVPETYSYGPCWPAQREVAALMPARAMDDDEVTP